MAKTLQDYLGTNATLNGTIVSIDLTDLDALADGDSTLSTQGYSDDQAVAIIVAGLDKTTRPAFDSSGLPVVDPEAAIVSSESFAPKTFEVRGEQAQVKHEFVFAIYTVDNTDFDTNDVV